MKRLLLLLAACGSTPPPAPAAAPAPAAPTSIATPSLSLADTGVEVSWLDTSADPCTDFYQYACGGFLKSVEIPADRATYGATQLVQKRNEDTLKDILEKAAADPGGSPVKKKIGDYFAACMDEDRIEKAGLAPLAPLFEPIAKVKDEATVARAITVLHAHGVFPFFLVDSSQDSKDATLVIGILDQSGLSLPDRDYYLVDEGNLKEIRTAFAAHVARVMGLLGTPAREAKAAADDVLRIETALARLQQDKVTRRDPYKVYHRVERDGLAKLAPRFPWAAYFKGVGYPDKPELSVNLPEYYTAIAALLRAEKPAALRHYLAYQVVRHESPLMPKAFVDEVFAMRQKITGQREIEPRWKRCTRAVDGHLGQLLGQVYVAQHFAGESKDRARAIVEGIREAMRADLAELSWMDAATREAARAKIDDMNAKVGYPDRWRVYDFDVGRESYAQNALAADRFELRRNLNKIGKPVDKSDWYMTPPTVNASYEPLLNEIAIPAGALQPPFFSKDFYPPISFGDIGGNWIGHEITHGFDDEGSQFDSKGNLRDWWSAETKKKFADGTRCVQDQFSKYEAIPGVKLNGALTSGENIADIGGVKLGYYALLAWKRQHPEAHRDVAGYTDEKLYFLGYAQGWCAKTTPQALEMQARTNPHSPERWRVVGPIVDNPTFAQAFQCAGGTPMNPGNVCTVW